MITKDEFIIPQKLSLWDFYRTSLYVTLRSKRLSWLYYFVTGVGVLNLFVNIAASAKAAGPIWILVLQSLLPLLVLMLFLFGGTFIICVVIKLLKPGIFNNMTYQFTHWGLYKKSDIVDYSIPWRNIVKVKETRSFIYLYFSKDDAHVIQKKMFRHVDELQSFKIFMKACVNQK
ncbi:YcxB family protein [Ferruginibacter sp.]|nr:YcxB family protein [Ferruginibacter sp.]